MAFISLLYKNRHHHHFLDEDTEVVQEVNNLPCAPTGRVFLIQAHLTQKSKPRSFKELPFIYYKYMDKSKNLNYDRSKMPKNI